jgi:CheY-like chemotaxis protein
LRGEGEVELCTAMPWELLGVRVLVVEDEPIIALDLEGILAGAGATVVGPAYRVSQALDLLDTGIDVAVLDFRLETETATSIVHRLSAKGIPYLFCTSSRGHPELAHAGVPVIDKPAHPNALIAAVRALIQQQQNDE